MTKEEQKIINFPKEFIYNEEIEKKMEEKRRREERLQKRINDCRDMIKPVDNATLFVRWIDIAFFTLKQTLYAYCMKSNNKFFLNYSNTLNSFIGCDYILMCTYHFLNDLTIEKHHNLRDIIIATYGRGCDEVYLYDKFITLYEQINHWHIADMWNDCGDDIRLRKIIDDTYGK